MHSGSEPEDFSPLALAPRGREAGTNSTFAILVKNEPVGSFLCMIADERDAHVIEATEAT